MDPLRNPDETAGNLARQLLAQMTHAVIAVIDPVTGHPHLSRIACQADPDGTPIALLSALAAHTRALAQDNRAGLLVTGPEGKGDPMTHPRLSLQVVATKAPPAPDRRTRWLSANPRAAVFIDLPDFAFWRLTPRSGLLNAGFGAAFRLTADDMKPPPG